jgi:hypothetical protein
MVGYALRANLTQPIGSHAAEIDIRTQLDLAGLLCEGGAAHCGSDEKQREKALHGDPPNSTEGSIVVFAAGLATALTVSPQADVIILGSIRVALV